MPMVSQMQHPQSLDFPNQRKAYRLRTDEGLSYAKIAELVVNLRGEASTAECVRRAIQAFSVKKGMSVYKYSKCGRAPWKLTKDAQAFLIRKLLSLRKKSICTSTTLQKALAEEMSIKVSDSTVRKFLLKKGSKWLPRAQKRQYSDDDKKKRLAFAKKVIRLGAKGLKDTMSMAMDGVVLAMPPTDPTDRENHCKHGESHMWRKPGEAAHPDLAGEDPFAKQLPLARSVPLWGGISHHGVAEILIHKTKKCSVDEWATAIRKGKMMPALRQLRPHRRTKPWLILCDGEHFLTSKEAKKAYAEKGIALWQIPPRSPDQNPIEKFWGWLRRELRRRDLQDWNAKRPPLGRIAYRARLRAVLKSKKAQGVAGRYAAGLLNVCKEIVQKKGAASRG